MTTNECKWSKIAPVVLWKSPPYQDCMLEAHPQACILFIKKNLSVPAKNHYM